MSGATHLELVHQEARAASLAGACVVPPLEDGSKAPQPVGGRWNQFKEQPPSSEQLRQWYPGRSGLGVVAGDVSGGIECWDFDDENAYQRLIELAEAAGLFALVDRIANGYEDRTPGGGRRWLVRGPLDCRTGHNLKLARRPKRVDEQQHPNDQVKVLIELPDYAITAPTNGRVHPTGGAYTRLSGGFDTIASYTAEERADLIALARALDEMPAREFGGDRQVRTTSNLGGRPGDDYSARASWAEVLEPHGWRAVYTRGETTYWRRPGKSDGVSATTNHAGSDLLYVFSSSTPFDTERGYNKFSAYAVLTHGGDFKAAGRELRARGYGSEADHTTGSDQGPEARTFNLTDAGNGEYFAAHQGRDVRFDHQRGKWLLWRGIRWQPDAEAEIRRRAKDAMRQRLRDAADLDLDQDQRARHAKWAASSESRARIDALLYLAQAEPPITDTGQAWDAHGHLIGVPNGVVDLRTGALRDAQRDDRITLLTSTEYHPDARSDLWDQTLEAVLPDADLRAFFHVAIGYCATGDTSRDCWFLAHGSGRNGKGTLLNPIRRALGDYALELPGAVFDLRAERSPYELAYLPGRRFVTSSESGDTLRLHHDRIKQLTGGDSVSAANKYEKAFEFEPVCKLWLACNTRPRTTDDTAAFWARVLLIPFTQSFVGREDRGLRPTLTQDPAHQAAVLAWIVRGAVRYYAEGLNDPPALVSNATTAYREDSDPLALFLGEACTLAPEGDVAASEFYRAYEAWADRQHYTQRERLSATMFGRRMGAKFDKSKDKQTGVNRYQGVRLRA